MLQVKEPLFYEMVAKTEDTRSAMKISEFMLNFKGVCRMICLQVINYNLEVWIEDIFLR